MLEHLTNTKFETVYCQDPLHVFRTYVSMKLHFTKEDYIYNVKGLKQMTQKTLAKRVDKLWFIHLAKKFNEDEAEQFLLAQFVYNPVTYIGDVIIDKKEANKRYASWVNRIDMLEENLNNDIQFMLSKNKRWKDILIAKPGQHAEITKYVIQNRINPETYTLLNEVFKFIPPLDTIKDDMLLYSISLKLIKYKHFLKFPISKLVTMIPKV